MSSKFESFLNDYLYDINMFLDYYSKRITHYFEIFTNKDYLQFLLFTKNKKNKHTQYVYYSYVSLIKIFTIFLCISFLLLMVLQTKQCEYIQTENIIDKISQFVSCKNNILLIAVLIIISISYLLGGIIRLIGMILFILISVSVLIFYNKK